MPHGAGEDDQISKALTIPTKDPSLNPKTSPSKKLYVEGHPSNLPRGDGAASRQVPVLTG